MTLTHPWRCQSITLKCDPEMIIPHSPCTVPHPSNSSTDAASSCWAWACEDCCCCADLTDCRLFQGSLVASGRTGPTYRADSQRKGLNRPFKVLQLSDNYSCRRWIPPRKGVIIKFTRNSRFYEGITYTRQYEVFIPLTGVMDLFRYLKYLIVWSKYLSIDSFTKI